MRTRIECMRSAVRTSTRRSASRAAISNERKVAARPVTRRASVATRMSARRTRPVALTPRGFVPLVVH